MNNIAMSRTEPGMAGERAAASPKAWSAGRRVATALLVGGAAVGAVACLYAYGPQSVAFVTTDNAYVKGDVTFISPKVPGYVTAVLTENNAKVVPGQVLIRIDPTDYRSAVADGEAAIAQAEASLRQIGAQEQLQEAQIRAADANVTSAKASAVRSSADFRRSDALVGQGAVSRQLFEAAEAENVRSRSSVAQTEAQAQVARRQLGVLGAQRLTAQAQIQSARAKLVRARADLDRTQITAPREGRVAARNIRLGEFVNTGTRLLAITPTRGLWIEANLRETQLARIRSGDRVQVGVDAVPDVSFCGVVEGAFGASGSEFSVIPPDNATGNFTKIVRRFTVRILLDPDQPGLERLSTGMSVTPRIEVGSHEDGRSHGGLVSWLVGGSFTCGKRS
ncbi:MULTISPECIES: HlyD family secretion protein [unclassified Sphingobium]|uniref:HlyD family secretion protein n=1 Tax=unclassified Sphingobium TaxID=2611147 RepID=UPI0035A72C1C